MDDEIKLKSKNSFLGVKEVWSDIKAIPRWFKIMLVIGSILILFFNFFDVQGGGQQSFFIPINQYNSVLATDEAGNFINYSTFGHTSGAAIAVAVLYSLNGLAAFTGLLAVAMIVFAKPSQYFWGMVNAFIFGLFVLSVGYVGDFFMNVIKFLTAIPAWWMITYLFQNNKLPSDKKSFLISFWILVVFIAAFVIMMWLFFIPEAAQWIFSNDAYLKKWPDGLMWGPQHILDGMTAGLENVAYIFQIFNLGEQFYVWFFVNILKLLKFTNIAPNTLSINMILQFGVFFAFALVGLYERNIKDIFIKWGWVKAPVETNLNK